MSRPLTLISSKATQQLLAELLEAYRELTGQPVQAESVGGVDAARRVGAGESFDLVVLASKSIDELVEAGRVAPGSRTDLVRSGVSVAVPAGRAAPKLASESDVREAVLASNRLSYSTGPSGVHLQRLFERWGIADRIRERVVLAPAGVPVASLVADGRADLGFQQTSELLNVPGIQIVGPLPNDIQIITIFSAGLCASSREQARARALMTWLASPTTADAKKQHGMEPAI
jgi:molybdate transport system substrate-binding protein